MKNSLVTKNPQKRGFSLLELSIVLTIVGILLYATVAVGMTQIEVAKVKATQDKLEKIGNAITIYYKSYGYLPCPADGQTAITVGTFGTEQPTIIGTRNTAINTSGASNVKCSTAAANGLFWSPGTYPAVYVGVVPVRSLNLSDELSFDSWGNRITYIVSRNCVAGGNWSTTLISANQYACNDGATAAANGNSVGITNYTANTAAYMTISHGKNSLGAWSKAGTKKLGTATCNAGEQTNANFSSSACTASNGNTSAVTTYYDSQFNDGTAAPAGVPVYYDDIVRWKSAQQIHYDANH